MNCRLKTFILAPALAVLSASAGAAVKTKVVEYKHGKTALEGHLAWDDVQSGPRPAVLVVHEWKGLNAYAKTRAEQLAALGYVAFAVDMYGKGVQAKDHDEAAKLSGVYRGDRALMRARAQAGLDVLMRNPGTDPSRIAAIGYCFGGTTVLELARAGAPVRGVASFHGGLDAPLPAQPGAVKAKVLVFQGGDDAWTAGGVPAFQEEMRKAGADWELVAYGGAVHSFTVPDAGDNPSTGMAYDADADRRSWKRLQDFLSETLK